MYICERLSKCNAQQMIVSSTEAFGCWNRFNVAALLVQMEKEGHRCTSIRGDMDVELRDKVVGEFRAGITKILISTDVLSRGFDVTQACTLGMFPLAKHACHALTQWHWANRGVPLPETGLRWGAEQDDGNRRIAVITFLREKTLSVDSGGCSLAA